MIPKIIHYCWLGEDILPDKIQSCIDSWKKRLPEYDIKLWNTETFDVSSVKWVKEACEAKKYAFAADYIRFYALYNFGGIYLDTDVEVMKPFNDLLDYESFIGFEFSGIPESAVIGAQKELLWIKKCMDWYHSQSFYDKKGKMRQIVVPFLMKSVFENEEKIELIDNGKLQLFGAKALFPYIYFSPKNFYSGKIVTSPHTYTIHYSEASWVDDTTIVKLKRNLHIILITLFGKQFHDIIIRFLRKIKFFLRKKNSSF